MLHLILYLGYLLSITGMKIFLIVFIIIVIILLLLQFMTVMSTQKTERQKYTVVHTEPEFEIRFYPQAVFATIYSSAKTYRELASPGFRRLAAYIFGGNDSRTKISMTAPVQMNINDSLSEMSFVMPAEYETEKLPKPNDSKVTIHKTQDEYVAAIRFGGFASDEQILINSEKLKNLLTSKGIDWSGRFRYLGYNPPWQLIGRRNEIIVSVKWGDN